MRRFLTLIVCLACIDLCSAIAAEGLQPVTVGEHSQTADTVVDLDGPVFDYPISRAIGIDVHEILAPPIKPSLYDLAPIATD